MPASNMARRPFRISALTAGGNVEKLIEQANALKPKRAVIGDEKLYDALKAGLAAPASRSLPGAPR